MDSNSNNSVLGQILFVSSIGSVIYLMWCNKKNNRNDCDANYYMIQDLDQNPSPFYVRSNDIDTRIVSSLSPIYIDRNSISHAIKDKLSVDKNSIRKVITNSLSPKSSQKEFNTPNLDTVRDSSSQSNRSSNRLSNRNKRKDFSSRPTVHAPNPIRENEKKHSSTSLSTSSTNTVTTTGSNTTPNSNSMTEESITSSTAIFFDIASPILLEIETVSDTASPLSDFASPISLQNETLHTNDSNENSTNFDTPQSGPDNTSTPYQNQVNILSTDVVITTTNDWKSPIFADVKEWDICPKTGLVLYVLECQTTKGPLLQWNCNKTIEQFQELKKELNLLLDFDIDLVDINALPNTFNNDEDTHLWHNCSILSKLMMTIILREDIMTKSSTFHLVTDFLDPDN